MKSLVFVTSEDLLDVDMPVVKNIHDKYIFTWVIVLRGYGWFTPEKIKLFLKENNINARIFIQDFKLKSPKTFLFHIKLLFYLKSLKADIYYDSYLGTPFLHFFSSGFINRNRFVLAIHDVVLHFKMNNYAVRSFYYNHLKRNFKHIHVFSQNQYRILKSQYRDKEILLSPLCLKDFGKPKSIRSGRNSNINFLFFGILRENKGIALLIGAAQELARSYQNFTVTIAGKSDGNCWEKLKVQVENDEKFKLIIRTIANEEVPDLLTSADFMVLPYIDATQSGVLLTSYNYNLPVIASDLEGFKEYVQNGENGYLFETGNVKSLIQKMKEAIELSDSEYFRIKENLAGFTHKKINSKEISNKYMAYFDQLA